MSIMEATDLLLANVTGGLLRHAPQAPWIFSPCVVSRVVVYRTKEVAKVASVHWLQSSLLLTSLALEIGKIATSASLIAMALLLLAPHVWAQTSAGSVGVVTGKVTVERAGRSIQAAAGTALMVGDKLTTGPNSSATIGLGDGSQLELNESSTLVLTENIVNPDGSRASTKITLLGGLVRSLVHLGPGGRPNFEVHTPNAVASARGTMFDVSYNEKPPSATP
jgi:hypothetical protein